MATPLMLQLAEAFRLRLLARERRSATALVQQYGQVWARLQENITRLQGQIDAMREAGEEVTDAKIFRMARYKELEAQLERELGTYSQFADETIQGGMRYGVTSGEQDAWALQMANYPKGVNLGITLNRLPREAVESMVGTLADGTPLLELLNGYTSGAGKAAGEALVRGLSLGWNPRKTAKEVRDAVGMGLTDSLRVARTEQLRAYRTATLYSYQKSDVVIGWERHAAKSDRTCAACLLLDGKVYTTQEAMDDHVSGRCSPLPLCKSWKDMGIDLPEPQGQRVLGKDWLQAQDEMTQRKILGNARFDAWKGGKITLESIPKLVEDPVWGNSWVVGALPDEVRNAVSGAD